MKRTMRGAFVAALCLGVSTIASAQGAGGTPAGKPEEQKPQTPPTVQETVVVVGGVKGASPIDTLGAVSSMSRDGLDTMQPSSTSDMFRTMPGMAASRQGDDAGTVLNVRGLQDNGRVLVVVDGARQDFSRPTHAGYGTFYLDPDLLQTVTVVRGASAGLTGGIGGVVSLETLSPADLLRGREQVAARQKFSFESNGSVPVSSTTAAVRVGSRVSFLGNFVARRNHDYSDGSSQRILNTHERPKSTLFKSVVTPSANQAITLSYTGYRNDYMASRQGGSSSPTLSVDQTDAANDTFSGRWAYANPARRLVNVVVNGYSTTTDLDQVKVRGTVATLGELRGYDVTTSGVNGSNVSRLAAWGMSHVITVGADYLRDKGSSNEISNGNGTRDSFGVFGQWEGAYKRLQLVASLRHDAYELRGLDRAGLPVETSSNQVSPRFTAGVTPLAGLTVYGTYVEGFRAPALYEVFGIYASSSVYQLGFDLRPEDARTIEGGVNFRKTGWFSGDSRLDVKLNVYDTRVSDFITGRIVSGVAQFNNLSAARLKGTEVDATFADGWGYAALAASLGSARREGPPYDGLQLSTAPLDRVTATLGLNALDNRVRYGAMLMHIDDKARDTSSFPTAPVAPAYTLTYLFASGAVNDWLEARFNVDNLFNRSFNDPLAQYSTTSPTSFQGRGRTFKFSLTARVGG